MPLGKNHFKKGYEIIKSGSKAIQKSHSESESRSIHLTGATSSFSLVIGVVKILTGFVTFSVFTCINGCYTLGMALARHCALIGTIKCSKKRSVNFYYKLSVFVMITASLLYIAYSLWTIWHPKTVEYGKYMALAIATVTFTEIGMNIYGVIKYRKGNSPLMHILKTISLATSLISLVLTQSAILSFADKYYNNSPSGILGAIMGAVAVLLGVYLLFRIKHTSERSDKE